MHGAEAVLALVLVEWTGGLLAAAGWSQSWSVVRRGHFKIIAWIAIAFSIGALFSFAGTGAWHFTSYAIGASIVFSVLYLGAQYVRTETVAVIVGLAGAASSVVALIGMAMLLEGWIAVVAAVGLIAGMVLLGGVANGMLLGHWYLNQPGLQPWALGRLTDATLAGVVATVVLGLATTGKLASASTEGAVLGLPGFGESFAVVFFVAWLAISGLTATVVWMARRCVKIRSIQSATGLYYVALLTAAVSEFLVRYLMVNA